MSNQRSVTGRKLCFLFEKFEIQSIQQLVAMRNKMKEMRVYILPNDEKWKVNLIAEIALIKKDQLDIEFDEEDLISILNHICCD